MKLFTSGARWQVKIFSFIVLIIVIGLSQRRDAAATFPLDKVEEASRLWPK